jgi:DHA2 family multidrug resistance protein
MSSSPSRSRTVIIVITAALASLLEIIDSSIVNVAIPTMMGNLGATLDEISWVSTGYMIANSIVLPIAAWLGSQLGRRSYFTGAILLFTFASFLCGIAPNLPTLVLFRIFQGLAGGALLPTSQTLIQEQFPREKAGMAMAIFGMSVMIGPAIGPTLGGYLTDTLGWRSIFNINIPLGLLAAFMSWLNVEDSAHQKGKGASPVDWLGLFFLCVGVGCFQFILERGEVEGWWDSNLIRVCSVAALTGVSSFIYWELKIAHPIMNLRLFKENAVRSGTMMMLMLGVLVYSLTFVVPIFVTRIVHLTATQTGELFIPGSIFTAAIMFPVGLLTRKVSLKLMVVFGLMLGEMAMLSMSQFTSQTGGYDVYVPLILRGVATAFLFVPINQMVLGQFSGEALGQVAGMQNFFRQMGGSIGIASLSTLLTHFGSQNYNNLISRVTPFDPMAYRAYQQGMALPLNKLASQAGFGTPAHISLMALNGRVQQQVFVQSFQQLCWVIIFVVALAFIPLYLIKVKGGAAKGPIVDAH